MTQRTDRFVPGDRVRVTQQVQHKGWTNSLEGVVLRYEQRKTGSWFAHSKDEKLWLDRLVVRKDDGELVVCNLDEYSHVEIVEAAPGSSPGSASGAGPGTDVKGAVGVVGGIEKPPMEPLPVTPVGGVGEMYEGGEVGS